MVTIGLNLEPGLYLLKIKNKIPNGVSLSIGFNLPSTNQIAVLLMLSMDGQKY